jgi:ribosomal protein L11 methyltransferase
VNTAGIEPLCGRLLNIGINGFVINDPADFAEFLEHKTGNWDYIDDELMKLKASDTSVTVYIADNEQGAETLSLLREQTSALKNFAETENLDFGSLSITLKNVREEDWADNWKQYFKPIKIGNKLLIKPSWEEISDTDNRKVLEIDPGSSFGTGQHHTTKLCLELLEDAVKPGERLLDLGCGSGILGIAALLLRADFVQGVDIDANAVRVADENFTKNNVIYNQYKLNCGNIIADTAFADSLYREGGYNIITANIVADVIISMSGLFRRYLSKDGLIILSGIIKERADEVYAAMETAGYIFYSEKESGGWVAAVFKRG